MLALVYLETYSFSSIHFELKLELNHDCVSCIFILETTSSQLKLYVGPKDILTTLDNAMNTKVICETTTHASLACPFSSVSISEYPVGKYY